ncbi:chemerin-like receptor 2 isoform X3 [Hydra vulgaris]|uniref:Chemerin-like receptor 2 isoform X3 n=1 Tax=Hydra vulgaris TaxID=6087 RepID=A0ABM4CQ36_HYDVU
MRKWYVFISIMVFSGGSETNVTSSRSDFNLNQKYPTSQANIHNETVTYNNSNNVDISSMSLEELCRLMEVPAENCSCENPDTKKLCVIVNTKIIESFSCDVVTNKIIGISNLISSTLALIGNGFVIGFGFTNRKNLSRFRYLIIGLSVSDFFFALFQAIVSIPETWTCHWIYGLFFCKVLRASLAASANIAVGFIVIIAVNRYIGVVYMFSTAFDQTKMLTAVIINVLAGILSIIPPLFILQLGKFATCSEVWSKKSSTIYTWVLFLTYYFIPVVTLIFLYLIMIASIKKAYLKSNVINDEQRMSRLKKNKKNLFMLVLILVAFAVLVLPNRIVWIVNDLYGLNKIDKNLERLLKMLSEITYGFHAAVNPIIYSLVDKKFKLQLKTFFSGVKDLFWVNPSLSSSKSRSASEITIQMNITNASKQ